MGAVPGGVVIAGAMDVYYLAVCTECGDMVVPFGDPVERDEWVEKHPHDVKVGLELRRP
jgi:hypothetical protein